MHLFAYHAKHARQNQKYMFWQKTNHATALNDPHVFDQKMDYIHENPVTAGLVTDSESWM